VLPKAAVLIAQGVPGDVAERFGQVIVSVNYHPGSLCCLTEQYRFRDGDGGTGRYQSVTAPWLVLAMSRSIEPDKFRLRDSRSQIEWRRISP